MLLKISGAVLVTAACAVLGLYYSGLEGFRIQDLSEFKRALLILSSEIEYISAPLPEAMISIGKRTNGPVSRLFTDFAAGLAGGSGETAYRLWEAAVEKQKKHSYLTAEDFEVITAFGKTLGYLDKPMQLNTIRCAVDYIDGKCAALQANSDKNKRMYRSLGLLGGVLLAVVLW